MSASAPPRLPVFYELGARAEWRAVEFISDLHLGAASPATTDAFEHYLAHCRADAIYILGDLFEAWIGDDARRPGRFEQRVADALAEAASQRQVGFMVGNRDFLLGVDMLQYCGVVALPDPTVFDAWGQRVLLTHGDALCVDDLPYQQFRERVRSPAWRAEFLRQPLERREALAREMRDASQASQRDRATGAWIDVDAAAAVAWMHAAGSHDLVHGHTHRPGSEVLAPGYTRHVLSDWDLDDARPRAQVLRLTRDGFVRIDLAAAG